MKIKRMMAVVMMLMMIATRTAFAEDASAYFVPQYIGGEDIRSVRRGDTFVVSIESYLLEKKYFDEPSSKAKPEDYKGEEAVEFARKLLSDAEFEKFCEDYDRTGEAKGTAYKLDFVGDDEKELSMDTRLIGSKWVTITRPIEVADGEWDTAFYVNRMELYAKDGKLKAEVTGSNKAYLYLEPKRMKNVTADISVTQDGLDIEVFSLVKQLWDVYLRIGDVLSNPLQGYADGKNGVFCCILNDEEAKLLKDGAKVALLRG